MSSEEADLSHNLSSFFFVILLIAIIVISVPEWISVTISVFTQNHF